MRIPAGVAAGHPATTEVGIRTLAMGGTAADAAVAATLAACVAETIYTGLGGGGFATYYEASTGRVTCLDFFCTAPGTDGDRQAAPMTPIAVRFGEVPIPYEIGGPSVAVPGVPAGCGEVHLRWGRLPWLDVVAPAVELARIGAPIPVPQALTLPQLVEAMLHDQGTPVYAPGGVLLRGGDLLYHPGLADALSALAEQGPDVFYTGDLGTLMIDLVRANGGSLGARDLASYRVLERSLSPAMLAGNMVLGRADLNQTLASVRALPDDLTFRSRPERQVALARVIGFGGERKSTLRLGNTTNVTAVDAEGNACVITTTLGLGSGLWLPGLGVHLNSMLGEGELITGELAPGERMSSMMCPLVVLDSAGRLRLALGSAGGSRIRSALLATLLGVLVDGMGVPEAVTAPRLHAVEDVVHIESEFPEAEAAALADAGFKVNRWPSANHYFGGVSAVGAGGAGGDPRRGGLGLVL